MSSQPDILVFMSDQHTGRLMSCAGDDIVETPRLDAIAAAGTRFSRAITNCPLCVPARCGFMTGQRTSKTGIFCNSNIMPSEAATVAHSCAGAGYETILCGRMHFSGQDQRHGFERRIMGDFTPCIQGRGQAKRADLGPYVETPAGKWIKHYGAGDSPVLAYDRAVVAAAIEELSKPHERPILMVVGTYGPHHTFVAPPALFEKYYERIDQPIEEARACIHPADRSDIRRDERLTTEALRCLRAAYYGMIEHSDHIIGQVYDAFQAHQQRHQRQQLFIYTSDHGEQAGHRGLWGKMNFYNDAIDIPLIIAGDQVQTGHIISDPVSMLDIPVTICDVAGGRPLPDADGQSLVSALQGQDYEAHDVICEINKGADRTGRLVQRGAWKYWRYAQHEQEFLINMDADPLEITNLIDVEPDIADALRAVYTEHWDPVAIQAEQKKRAANQELFNDWGANAPIPEPDRWVVPESAWVLPTLPESVH